MQYLEGRVAMDVSMTDQCRGTLQSHVGLHVGYMEVLRAARANVHDAELLRMQILIMNERRAELEQAMARLLDLQGQQ